MKRENFSSRFGIMMALAGSAIGLGNIWRFPYMAGEYGGAVFVLVYVASSLLISLPVFIAEATIGRRSRTNVAGSFSTICPGRRLWRFAGLLGVIIPSIIVSYYSVIGGWSLEYFFKSCTFSFARIPASEAGNIFGGFISSSWLPVALHLLFFLISALVVVLGVKAGIERFSKVTLPVLFVLIVVIAVYSLSLPGSMEGVRYLFKPDFSNLTAKTFAYAMGQSFYSLSLGMGAVITYGSYMRKEENILVTSAGTALSDLMFALLAGLAIMPAVFAAGIEPGAGPGLIFQSIPYIFSKMGESLPVLSSVIAIIFFFSIVIAAMTSTISLIEVGTDFLIERFGKSRRAAVGIIFLICGGLGILCSLSFGPLSGITVQDKNLFDILDWLASNILLLVMGFLAVYFAGFVMKKEDFREEFTNGGTLGTSSKLFSLVYFLIKWVAPIAVVLIFLTNFIL